MKQRSRYQDCPHFEPVAVDQATFAGRMARDARTEPGVLEHTLRAGDRLDLLALHYYGDTRMGWRILDANPGLLCGMDIGSAVLSPGQVLLIPASGDGTGAGS